MTTLILEILSEEMPATLQKGGATILEKNMVARLGKGGLVFETTEIFYTPRRLCLIVKGLPLTQPLQEIEIKGPKVDAPQRAIDGFLKKVAFSSVDMCEKRELARGTFLVAVKKEGGAKTKDILPTIITQALEAMEWPKSMRFGAQTLRWVRPLHNILAVFDGHGLEGALSLGPDEQIIFSNKTYGHRFLAPSAFEVTTQEGYKEELHKRFVCLSAQKRQDIIEQGFKGLTQAQDLHIVEDNRLLNEVVGLVEWPVPLLGKIDSQFMVLPKPVLSTTMRVHQKYFTIVDAHGNIADRFGVVANKMPPDGGAIMLGGFEKVLRARLSDAYFFWEQDKKIPLEAHLEKLKSIVFHAKLGTIFNRVERLVSLSKCLGQDIQGATIEQAERAALLCKTDLVTGMVYEFPELQGIMGGIYATQQNEEAQVALAIKEHYKPQGPQDSCPHAPISVVLGLGEKIDILVGFWLIDEKPTGSKDPFALRRATLGIIRLILENNYTLHLSPLFEKAIDSYAKQGIVTDDKEGLIADLMRFFMERMKVYLKSSGIRHDIFQAVAKLYAQNPMIKDDLLDVQERVKALQLFLETFGAQDLITGYKRASRILEAEGLTEKGQELGVDLFEKAEEKALFDKLLELEPFVHEALRKHNYTQAMTLYSELKKPIDAFFEEVTVNDERPEQRYNRLSLLAKVCGFMDEFADFSQIEG